VALVAPARCAQAAASAAAAVGLGAAGHVLGGGLPGLGGVALAFLLIAVPSWMLAGRERGWAVIASVQVAAQQVMHPVLDATADTASRDALPHDVAFYLHLLGALFMAVWLRVGERRLWAAARRVAARLAHWWDALATPLAVAAMPPVPTAAVRAGFRAPPLRHVVVRRGPPHTA